MTNILIISNDKTQRRQISQLIRDRLGLNVVEAPASKPDLEAILQSKDRSVSMVIVHAEASDTTSLLYVRKIKAHFADAMLLAMVDFGKERQEEESLFADADEVLEMPCTSTRLLRSLRQLMKLQRMQRYVAWLERSMAGHISITDIIGNSASLKPALSLAHTAAATRMPVWIEGGAGSGKEWFARAIHGSSDRAGKPFVVVNCQMVPSHMAEALLFGQEHSTQPGKLHFVLGKLREAHQGTLVLKEINALPRMLQDRLLDLLQSGTYQPYGGGNAMQSDARIICTTSQSASYFALEKNINQSLHRRLRQTTITLPSLQERREDIPVLAQHFLAMYSASEHKYITGISEQALQWLINAPWPGNVRQLSHVIWRAVLLCDDTLLQETHLQMVQHNKPIYFADVPSDVMQAAGTVLVDQEGNVKSLKSVEEEAIRFALLHAKGCMTRAAKNLGIGRSTLYRKVSELNINVS